MSNDSADKLQIGMRVREKSTGRLFWVAFLVGLQVLLGDKPENSLYMVPLACFHCDPEYTDWEIVEEDA